MKISRKSVFINPEETSYLPSRHGFDYRRNRWGPVDLKSFDG